MLNKSDYKLYKCIGDYCGKVKKQQNHPSFACYKKYNLLDSYCLPCFLACNDGLFTNQRRSSDNFWLFYFTGINGKYGAGAYGGRCNSR